MNREAWLTELSEQVKPLYEVFKMAPYRLTCGWPSTKGLSTKARRIGECHYPRNASGFHDIFVSPLLDQPLEVAGVVCHELAHVAAGYKSGHERPFVKVCNHVGLTKNKPTSAAPGPLLEEKLRKIIDTLGTYPHTKIQLVAKVVKPKEEVTLVCIDCGCRVRMTVKWLSRAGRPTCHCGSGFNVAEELEE